MFALVFGILIRLMGILWLITALVRFSQGDNEGGRASTQIAVLWMILAEVSADRK